MTESDDNLYPTFLSHDVPANLVDYTVSAVHGEVDSLRLTDEDWRRLMAERPEMHRYISDLAHELEPNDADKRELFTRGMLGVLVLAQVTEVNDQLELLLAASPEEPVATETFRQRRRARKEARQRGVGVGVIAAAFLFLHRPNAGGADANPQL